MAILARRKWMQNSRQKALCVPYYQIIYRIFAFQCKINKLCS